MIKPNNYELLTIFRSGRLFFREKSTNALLVADQSIFERNSPFTPLDPTKTDDGRLEVVLDGIQEVAIAVFESTAMVPIATESGERAGISVDRPELLFLKAYAMQEKTRGGAGGVARIIETDNFGGDYPDEKFLNLPPMAKEHATRVADAINSGFHPDASRYWRVVEEGYVLQPGFEP